jgi:bacillithiol biosynthesis cysteine-adding enzyme BshC
MGCAANDRSTSARRLDTARTALQQYDAVPAQSGSASTIAPIPLDIRRFPWTSRLAADYAFAWQRLAAFYAGDPADDAEWRAAAARAGAHPRDRGAVAAVLAAQQVRRAAPETARAATARLAAPGTVAVVTGQQAGLFGGPLFVLLKALGALRLARDLEARGIPAVTVFWAHGEDHDWDEVRRCPVLDAEGAVADLGLDARPGTRPVAGVQLDTQITAALDALRAALPRTEFSDDVFAGLAAAYRPGAGMAEAFATWIETLLGPHGLIVFEGSDPAAKPLVADVLARDVDGRTTALAADAGARLEAAGYHAQVTPRADALALFALDEATGERLTIVRDGDAFRLGDARLDRDALRAMVRATPERFSPNVLLRPVVQDTLFPTVCYVGGPAELAYFAQLGPVYEAFGVPMPLVSPRPSATLLDSGGMRFLARQAVPFEALRAQDDKALNQWLETQLPPAVDRAVTDAAAAIAERMGVVAAAVTAVDPTLEGAARSTAGRMDDELKKLQSKIIQASKRKDETLRRQFARARAQAFPGGQPQERAVGLVGFLNLHGPALVDRLDAELGPAPGTHWVLHA